MTLLRTEAMTQRFKEHVKSHPTGDSCVLCDKSPIREFKYWKIINNDFPYDRIAQEHHMLVPIRHVAELDLSKDELSELLDIKANIDPKYDFIIEATPKNKSIPAHYHLHLIVVN